MRKESFVAAAVAAMFAAGAAYAAEPKAKDHKDAEKSVKCAGINSCKGKSSCAGAASSCAGQNGCKGKGVTNVKSEKDCTDKGGTVVAAK